MGEDDNLSHQVGLGHMKRVLEETTGKARSFLGQVKMWCKELSQETREGLLHRLLAIAYMEP